MEILLCNGNVLITHLFHIHQYHQDVTHLKYGKKIQILGNWYVNIAIVKQEWLQMTIIQHVINAWIINIEQLQIVMNINVNNVQYLRFSVNFMNVVIALMVTIIHLLYFVNLTNAQKEIDIWFMMSVVNVIILK